MSAERLNFRDVFRGSRAEAVATEEALGKIRSTIDSTYVLHTCVHDFGIAINGVCLAGQRKGVQGDPSMQKDFMKRVRVRPKG